jgi:hypothetical protein
MARGRARDDFGDAHEEAAASVARAVMRALGATRVAWFTLD